MFHVAFIPTTSAVIKFRTDVWIALAVNFVTGKSPDMWPHHAPVEYILLVLDLDVFLPGFDDRAICVGAREAIVQIGMIRLILQFSRNLKWRCPAVPGRASSAEKVSESEIGIFQLRLRVEEFRLLVGQSHFSALHVQITNNAGVEALLLALEFLVAGLGPNLAAHALSPDSGEDR